ncbi:MAG: ATP-binding protein [Planctomycetes bacterium]|nr:ATP-binding protein [Planctomycetota bacterium]
MTSILVVDDSPSDLGLVVAHIQNARPDWEIHSTDNGADALVQIGTIDLDVLITDLRMPKMDGIQLIGALKQLRPELPVVVVTARGSEELAVEALAKGAASYVPKNQLVERLVETIEQVLDRVHADHGYQRVIGSLDRTEYEFTIENDLALIPPLVDLLQQVAFGMDLVDTTERRRLGVALDEAILNAMYHGNLELPADDLPEIRPSLRGEQRAMMFESRSKSQPYKDRRVRVFALITPNEAKFVVKDDGKGFDPSLFPDAKDPRTLEEEGGRGLVLMKSFMDEVSFTDAGNEVTLIKRRSP